MYITEKTNKDKKTFHQTNLNIGNNDGYFFSPLQGAVQGVDLTCTLGTFLLMYCTRRMKTNVSDIINILTLNC